MMKGNWIICALCWSALSLLPTSSVLAQTVYRGRDLMRNREGRVLVYRIAESKALLSGEVKIIEDSRRYTIARLESGILAGLYEEYLYGKVALSGHYTRGLRTGQWLEYYPSGALRKESTYREGALEGRVTVYLSNGRVERRLDYRSDKRYGEEQVFDPEGNEVAHYHWRDDKREGDFVEQTRLDGGMTVRTTGAYQDGRLHGDWRSEISVDGRCTHTIRRVYNRGTIESEETTRE